MELGKQSWELLSGQRAVVCSGPGDPIIMKGSAGLADSSPGAKAWFPQRVEDPSPWLSLPWAAADTLPCPSPHCQAEASTYVAGWHFRGFYGSWDLCTNWKHMKYSCCGLPTKKGLAWESCGMAMLGPRTALPPCWSLRPELTHWSRAFGCPWGVAGRHPELPDSGPLHRTGPLSSVLKLRKVQKTGKIPHSASVISETCQVRCKGRVAFPTL